MGEGHRGALMNHSEMLARFRRLPSVQQAAVVGSIFFVAYALYSSLILGLAPYVALLTSISSALLFAAVYYLTSALIMRMEAKAQKQSQGPRKGIRRR
jgi:predicted transporter